ncbi:MAG: sulfurtransferase, partial [Armatimonadota bacterium]
EEVWLLDGGIDTWKHEGREMSQDYPECPGSSFDVEVQEDFYITTDEVKKVKDQDDVILLDARPPEMYEGQAVWPKPGHIPGAVNLPWKKFFHEENTRLLRSDDEIQSLVDEHGITKDHHVICSCGTGREATAEFTIFKYLLDFPHVKIYEGSFTEWCHLDLPTVTGPNPE